MTVDDIESRILQEVREGMAKGDMRRVAYFSALAQELAERKEEWQRKVKTWIDTNGSPPQTQGTVVVPGLQQGDPRKRDFTRFPLRGYQIDGKTVHVTTFKDMLVTLANHLRGVHGTAFDDAVLRFVGRKRHYFSKDATALKYAVALGGGGMFVETNLNANLIAEICFRMADELGHGFGIN
jgi:hypothetical protein